MEAPEIENGTTGQAVTEEVTVAAAEERLEACAVVEVAVLAEVVGEEEVDESTEEEIAAAEAGSFRSFVNPMLLNQKRHQEQAVSDSGAEKEDKAVQLDLKPVNLTQKTQLESFASPKLRLKRKKKQKEKHHEKQNVVTTEAALVTVSQETVLETVSDGEAEVKGDVVVESFVNPMLRLKQKQKQQHHQEQSAEVVNAFLSTHSHSHTAANTSQPTSPLLLPCCALFFTSPRLGCKTL
jgi:hypothetical protein